VPGWHFNPDKPSPARDRPCRLSALVASFLASDAPGGRGPRRALSARRGPVNRPPCFPALATSGAGRRCSLAGPDHPAGGPPWPSPLTRPQLVVAERRGAAADRLGEATAPSVP